MNSPERFLARYDLPDFGGEVVVIYPGNDISTLFVHTVSSFGKYKIDITGE